MTTLARELQQILYEEIPITRQLRVTVAAYDGTRITLQAPLAQNINHKGTIFAGSLNAVATLAGWGMVWLILREANMTAQVIIQDSTVNYMLPVTRDFTVSCLKPNAEHIERFIAILRRKGRARIALTTQVDEDDLCALTFHGRYVAQHPVPAENGPTESESSATSDS
jgi:thioesterase domain-containing protein